MVFISRKIIYPMFVIIFTLVFFSIIYFVSFSQSLSVYDASFEVSGGEVLLKATIENVSNHVIKDATMLVEMSDQEWASDIRPLEAGEKIEIIEKFPLTSDLTYIVFISAPFNRTTRLDFELAETTIRPVSAEVQIAKQMVVGTKYTVISKLCNVSESDLDNIEWTASVGGSYFEEPLFPIQTDVDSGDCKNLYSTLTPITPGNANVRFVLKVGSLEQEYELVIEISGE